MCYFVCCFHHQTWLTLSCCWLSLCLSSLWLASHSSGMLYLGTLVLCPLVSFAANSTRTTCPHLWQSPFDGLWSCYEELFPKQVVVLHQGFHTQHKLTMTQHFYDFLDCPDKTHRTSLNIASHMCNSTSYLTIKVFLFQWISCSKHSIFIRMFRHVWPLYLLEELAREIWHFLLFP